jgi:hypothetical protein
MVIGVSSKSTPFSDIDECQGLGSVSMFHDLFNYPRSTASIVDVILSPSILRACP